MKVLENTATRLRLRSVPYGAIAGIGGITLLVFLWAVALWNAGEVKGALALFAIAALVFVGCFGVFAKTTEVTLDRSSDKAEVRQRGLFGKSDKTMDLSEIHGATLQSTVIRRKPGDKPSRSSPSRHKAAEPRVWRVAFVRKNGTPLPLTEVYGSEKGARALAGAINAWFGRPDNA